MFNTLREDFSALPIKCGCFAFPYSCVNVHNQQHVLVMCAVAFYLIENYPLDVGPEFSSGIIQVCAP